MKNSKLFSLITGILSVIVIVCYLLVPGRVDRSTPVGNWPDTNENRVYQAELAKHFDNEVNQKVSKLLDQIKTSREADLLLLASEMKQHGAASEEVCRIYDRNSKFEQGYCKQVCEVLDKYGWLGADRIGAQNNYTLFTTIQNADFDVQDKYMTMMEDAVKSGSLSPEHFASLVDRKALVQHHAQIYGTQVHKNPETLETELAPVADASSLNQRRTYIGLAPLNFVTEAGHAVKFIVAHQRTI